ncbi:MAG: cytochrome c family protein [Alphaproteobacteria bacterium]
MDGFEFNKIVASILIALLVGMLGSLISEALIHPQPLAKNGYVIVGIEDTADTKEGNLKQETIAAIEPLLATADASKGQQIAEKRCSQCHTFKKGEHNKIGPNLWNVVMNHFGHVSDFAFSSALKAKEGKWDFETLNHFIYKPNALIKGTKMSFAGLKDDKERADLIAFLATLNDTAIPLPSPNNQETK